MRQLPQVDQVLKAAADRGDVPGIVAMAATREGPVYQGAFGKRALPDGAAMTADTVFWIASMTTGIISCQNAALLLPLSFDPGDRWDYGINIDWLGKAVERVSGQTLGDYFAE